MSYFSAISCDGSAMSGKFSSLPVTSLMSEAHPLCESSGSTDTPITFTLRLSNSPLRPATAPSSVVQTGVKSFGCENRIAQLSPFHLWKSSFPSVVSAVNLGASSLMRMAMRCNLPTVQAKCDPPGRDLGDAWLDPHSEAHEPGRAGLVEAEEGKRLPRQRERPAVDRLDRHGGKRRQRQLETAVV